MLKLKTVLRSMLAALLLLVVSLPQLSCQRSVSAWTDELPSLGGGAPPPGSINFGANGVVQTNFSTDSVPTEELAQAMARQSDGKLLVAGFVDYEGSNDFALVRYNANGSLDASFGVGGKVITDFNAGSDDIAWAISVLGDGKILLAGKSSSGVSHDFALARYNSDGTLDTSFGTAGKVTTDIGTDTIDDVKALTIQTDGKILVAGTSMPALSNDFAVVRYNADGSLDTSFGTAGKVVTNFSGTSNDRAFAMALQTDGKVLVGGSTTSAGSTDFAVVRYNTNGVLDSGFGTGGKAITNFSGSSSDEVFSMALQGDGKILLAGKTSASGFRDFAVVRYDTNGTLDAGFGTGGRVATDIGSSSFDSIYGIALQSDGKIVAAGLSDSLGSYDFALVRYNANGTLDNTFGASGKVTSDIVTSSDDNAYAISVQSDGKIVAAGYSDGTGLYDFTVARYNADGSLDTGFSSDGIVITDIGQSSEDSAAAITLQPDGKIVMAGYSDSAGSYNFALARYNTDGSLDTNFGTGGLVTTDFGANGDDIAYAVKVQSDGKILAAGYTDGLASRDFALVRYNTDGSLDTSFGSGGKVITDVGSSSYDQVFAMTLQSDGKILAAGESTSAGSSDFTVVRYNTDGSLDTSFGSGGKAVTDIDSGSYDLAYAITLQNDGKVLVAGFAPTSGSTNFVVVRYTATGSLDSSFGSGGIVITDVGTNSFDYANAISLQSDDKILVAGKSDMAGTYDFALVRYNTDGTLDPSFGTSGKVVTDLATSSLDGATGIAVQVDGKILLTGSMAPSGSSSRMALVRYNLDGSLDTGFNSTGIVSILIAGTSEATPNAIAIGSDGKFYSGGYASPSASDRDNFVIARFNSDGSQ